MKKKSVMVMMLLMMLMMTKSLGQEQLSEDYYAQTCPNVESIISQATQAKHSQAPTSAAATVRLFFHDCFIEGCDGSILITSTEGNIAERDAQINRDLAGDAFDAVVKAKAAVEQQCPAVVSCADVLAIAARDFISLTGGPTYPVVKGRKDGLKSTASSVGNSNIPDASFNLNQLVQNFADKGLDYKDLVTLSGAHTFGFAHCIQFMKRLYNFSPSTSTDPTLDGNYAQALKGACPTSGFNTDLVEPFDPSTPFEFDNLYYNNLINNMALLKSDQSLMTSVETRNLVEEYASSSNAFFSAFAASMQKLGTIGVKTGNQGNIRIDCTRFN